MTVLHPFGGRTTENELDTKCINDTQRQENKGLVVGDKAKVPDGLPAFPKVFAIISACGCFRHQVEMSLRYS